MSLCSYDTSVVSVHCSWLALSQNSLFVGATLVYMVQIAPIHREPLSGVILPGRILGKSLLGPA